MYCSFQLQYHDSLLVSSMQQKCCKSGHNYALKRAVGTGQISCPANKFYHSILIHAKPIRVQRNHVAVTMRAELDVVCIAICYLHMYSAFMSTYTEPVISADFSTFLSSSEHILASAGGPCSLRAPGEFLPLLGSGLSFRAFRPGIGLPPTSPPSHQIL